jgi:hypothetical protein
MSLFEDAFKAALPAFFAQFGTAATHTNGESDEIEVTVILTRETDPLGDYGERAELRTLLDCAVTDGASVGDTWSIANAATDDDPDPDPTLWRADQLISDDGILQRYAVRKVTA